LGPLLFHIGTDFPADRHQKTAPRPEKLRDIDL
jgi:hypothetical protein